MASHRRFFDPEVYRIVLMDQRGAGKSRPTAELRVCVSFLHTSIYCSSTLNNLYVGVTVIIGN